MKTKNNAGPAPLTIIATILILGTLAFFLYTSSQNDTLDGNIGNTPPEEIDNSFDSSEVKTTEDGTKYIVDPDKIRRGIARPGDIKDAIPSIDDPKYISVSEANEWIEDNELVLALDYSGIKRVYPLQILVHHEIVNDFINDDPILITYCPLCGSGIAYERTINGEAVEFGTSGKLFNSNLIMYDRKTETYWQQIDGKAIVGELVPMELTEITIDTVTWSEWKSYHPDSEVLSKDTGHDRRYGEDPYGGYYEDDFVFFPVENEDNRIFAKTPILGIEVDGKFKAYRKKDVKEQRIIEDEFNGASIKLEALNDGRVKITNQNTGEEIIKEEDFWFAWFAFHPETELFGF